MPTVNMKKKEKIKVKICVGTSCFVQGGADLLLYNDFLDPALIDRCEIEGCSCFDACKQIEDATGKEIKPPFVEINGTIHGSVDAQELASLIRKAVNNA